MDLVVHHSLMADYNLWSNQNLLNCCRQLDSTVLNENKGAFFHSILGTLNHILVGDLMWMRRFAECQAYTDTSKRILLGLNQFPTVTALDQTLFEDIDTFAAARESLDELLQEWIDSLDGNLLNSQLTYKNSKGIESTRPLGLLISHFFNHQTHHRGQIGTLLHQMGLDPGVTDLLLRVPES